MSAAGRGGARVESDNYPTPPWCTRRILEALHPEHGDPWRIVEPCAGEGAIARVLVAAYPRAIVVGGDIRDVFETPGCVSYCWDATKPFGLLGGAAPVLRALDLLITNPPFNLAHEIIQAQRDTARLCVYLLRSSFIAGERAEAYRHDMPDEYRLPERPEFIASLKCKKRLTDGRRIDGCGWAEKVAIGLPRFVECPACGSTEIQCSTTDATPYSWFVWSRERKSVGTCRILPTTPISERRAP